LSICPLSFWPLYCLSFILLAIVLSVLYPFDHCIVCPLSFWPLYFLSFILLAIVLSVLLWCTSSHYLFGIFWPLYCLSFFDVHLLIISLVSSNFSCMSNSNNIHFYELKVFI
jgi:hypothetical protein